MKLLNKILKKSTTTSKKSEGQCDECQITIWQGDKALCFHKENLDEEVFLCESCIEKIYGEYVKELL
jgi:hypothetical protein